jgi:hypothetical protein
VVEVARPQSRAYASIAAADDHKLETVGHALRSTHYFWEFWVRSGQRQKIPPRSGRGFLKALGVYRPMYLF